ncbi:MULTISPECIES: carboxy-S-adenosyl-L-methionine synthase CmoA [Oceanospirillaceae]|jgi:tRNA (cmo5U34)-methyltransferase|uniref:Carboxy-S-adenosyl-L-methionine synthase n=1 Tax=Oceanobacter antarcticus TaxID=3133425 RepID=A0ABW8NDK4_9GAMM|tara:strand:- start:4322 stop:5062 length:741 start_codon:yes stop_codon:yes gene_type:complete
MNERDDLYQTREAHSADFRFDDAVARVFPDMIKRSVPGYAETVAMSGIIAGRYARDNTRLYDLGCSLGAVTLAMRHGVRARGCQVIGVDNSASMLERAAHYIALDDHSLAGDPVAVELLQADICSLTLDNASVTALNYVLQFIVLDQRLELLTRIAEATIPGGALILSEKISFEVAEQPLQDALHWDFKRANGYSEMEIARKRTAIEDYLIPEREEVHRQRLLAAGFSQVIRWYQCFNFVSFLAIR